MIHNYICIFINTSRLKYLKGYENIYIVKIHQNVFCVTIYYFTFFIFIYHIIYGINKNTPEIINFKET